MSVNNVSGKKLSSEQCGKLGSGCCSEDCSLTRGDSFLEGKIFANISGCEPLQNKLDWLVKEYCIGSICLH